MSDKPRFCYSQKTSIPTGGWWVQWEGQKVTGGDWHNLVRNCEKLTTSLGGVPAPDFSFQVEDTLCQRLAGDTACKPCSQVSQTISFNSIVRWVTAMYNFVANNRFELVEQDEAERRAAICASCPYQVSTAGCWGCKGIAGMLPAIAGARKTSYDAQLQACNVCGCYNAVSVHLPVNVQNGDDLPFPQWCWKVQSE
jgi:hypothetical protein